MAIVTSFDLALPAGIPLDLVGSNSPDDLESTSASGQGFYGYGGSDVLEGGSGNDVMFGGDGANTYFPPIAPEFSPDNDRLEGNKGNDSLYGERGNDLLDGGKGDDLLVGGWGDDRLIGGKGNDILCGTIATGAWSGWEIDKLEGGKGNDTFVLGVAGNSFYTGGAVYTPGSPLAAGAGYAVISDFKASQDTIQLDNSISYTLGYTNVTGGARVDTLILGPGNDVVGVIQDKKVTAFTSNVNGNGFAFA